jgi:hypothetical protein
VFSLVRRTRVRVWVGCIQQEKYRCTEDYCTGTCERSDTMTAFLGILVRNHKYLEYNFFSNHFYDTNLHTT